MRKKYETGGEKPPSFSEPTVRIENVIICNGTEKAWLLKRDGVKEKPFWVPKSLSHLHTHAKNFRLHDLEIVKRLAEEKGLLDNEPDDPAVMDEFDALIADRNKNRDGI